MPALVGYELNLDALIRLGNCTDEFFAICKKKFAMCQIIDLRRNLDESFVQLTRGLDEILGGVFPIGIVDVIGLPVGIVCRYSCRDIIGATVNEI